LVNIPPIMTPEMGAVILIKEKYKVAIAGSILRI
jgi:hypothetical protein